MNETHWLFPLVVWSSTVHDAPAALAGRGGSSAFRASDRVAPGAGHRLCDTLGRLLAGLGLLALVGCNGLRQNELLSHPVELGGVGAAHEAIYVQTDHDGWRRVFIDNGAADDWSPQGTIATSLDGSVRVLVEGDTFVIERAPLGRRVIAGLSAEPSEAGRLMSADGSWLVIAEQAPRAAIGEPTYDLVIVATADATVRRIATDATSIGDMFWGDGDRVWFGTERQWRQLDVATGAIDVPGDVPADMRTDGDETCAAIGATLTVEDSPARRTIMLVPRGSTSDPDRIATAQPRPLVSAESGMTRWPHGGPIPFILWGAEFTASCKSFVFEFGDAIYVGDIASGRFARIATGRAVSARPPGQRPAR